jgi:hypothetical protein
MRISVLLFLWLMFAGLWAQTNTVADKPYRHAVCYGVALGGYASQIFEGSGLRYYLAYEHALKNGKFKINPYLQTGGYGSKSINDSRDQWFTSTDLGCNLWLKAVDERTFSMSAGMGVLMNHVKGLKGTGGEDATIVSSQYEKQFQVGGYIGCALTLKDLLGRCNLQLKPINIHFGRSQYLDLYSTLAVNIKF